MRTLSSAVFLAIVFPFYAQAQEPGDPRAGLVYARTNCAECHAVTENDEKSPDASAPTFSNIAKMPGMTGRALAVWLQSSHPTMPDFLVAREDRDNAIAYIMGLQPVQAP
jgi:mono/diheme cytochrome c family protein